MPGQFEFEVGGKRFTISRMGVEQALENVAPESIEKEFVYVDGRAFPVEQVFVVSAGLSRSDFTTQNAAQVLRELGFKVSEKSNRIDYGKADLIKWSELEGRLFEAKSGDWRATVREVFIPGNTDNVQFDLILISEDDAKGIRKCRVESFRPDLENRRDDETRRLHCVITDWLNGNQPEGIFPECEK